MKTVFNNFILLFNFLLLGLVTSAVFKLVILGGSGRDLIAGYTTLIAPSIGFGVAFFRLAYPDRWRQLIAPFSGADAREV